MPGPFVPSAIASALISANDPKSPLLQGLAAGDTIAAYAIDSGLTATATDDKLVIRGEVRAVPPAAGQASVLVLPVSGLGEASSVQWVVLDADTLELEPVASIDRCAGGACPGQCRRGGPRQGVVQPHPYPCPCAHRHAAVCRVCRRRRWATDTATEYAKIREQFGRPPIGQFQAIKHKCSGMIAETERATAAVWDASRALDELRNGDPDSRWEFAAAVAGTLAPVASQHCAQECIQVHGGIGFTWEHDTNIFYRRSLILAASFGRAADYPQLVVDTATSSGLRTLNIDLDPDTEKLREEIRAEVAALKAIPREERNAAIAEGGWVQPHLPTPWGTQRRPPSNRSSPPRSSAPGRSPAPPTWASRPGSSRPSWPTAPTNSSSSSCPPPSAAR